MREIKKTIPAPIGKYCKYSIYTSISISAKFPDLLQVFNFLTRPVIVIAVIAAEIVKIKNTTI